MKIHFESNGYFKSIQEFVVIKQLGVGSFGCVKLALHIETNKYYAIKIISLQQNMSEKQLLLLERQILIHSQIDHPHIIKLWDIFIDSNSTYMVIQLAQNGNLFSYQNINKKLSQIQAYKFFCQTLNAIQYMHSLNIMHRDIKPQNILLDKNNNVKLCDLGWAAENIELKRKTFCGTYEYMAPQMIFQKQYNYKIDIWALGILLYELLHGHAPFKARSLQQIKDRITKGCYEVSNQFSIQLKDLISDLLQFNPEARPNIQTIKKSAWITKMKVLVIKQAKKIFFQQSQKKKQKVQDPIPYNSFKKHNRFESMQKYIDLKKNNHLEMNFKEMLTKNLNSKNKQIFSEAKKSIKKKCKTQGQQNLLKYTTNDYLKTVVNFHKKTQSKDFQNLISGANTTYLNKWKQFPQFSMTKTLANTNKPEPISMMKIKKINEKINEISCKNQKSKTRLKTYGDTKL